ncbi:hypothetical protein DM02DRAFT_663610 [Periconia macrospinosa]|uniref:Uncharacterized protein n=1 Tax=Periconia macrospinosa TaxID=97972 RepID=A0A2V1D162_9PLEO|nr:hypothetical protein DM02DRAFT_663610 [Periconia macrospinosa]
MPVPSFKNIPTGDAIRTIFSPRHPMSSVTIESLSSEKRDFRDNGGFGNKREFRENGGFGNKKRE